MLWDQGESSTGLVGIDQYTAMGALIKGWRKDWGQDFPFIYVQKDSGGGCAWDTTDPVTSKGDPLVPLPDQIPVGGEGRDNYLRIRNYPDTLMSRCVGSSHQRFLRSTRCSKAVSYSSRQAWA